MQSKTATSPTPEDRLLARIIQLAPDSAFPGSRNWGAGMVAALCPLDQVADMPDDLLREKLRQINFECRQSKPWDDDDYWMAQSPFDGRHYIFALLNIVSGPPGPPVYVLDQRPAWFDEE